MGMKETERTHKQMQRMKDCKLKHNTQIQKHEREETSTKDNERSS